MLGKSLLHCCLLLFFAPAVFGQNKASLIVLEREVERLSLPAISNSQTFRLQPVVVGQHYAIQLVGYDRQAYTISAINGGVELRGDDFYREFEVVDENFSFTLRRRAGWEKQENFRITIANLTSLNQRSAAGSGRASPIIVERNDNAAFLVDAIFRNNDCFDTNNQAFTGIYDFWPPFGDTLSQLGVFSNGNNAIGIDQGVVLTNGRTSEIGQANSNASAGYGFSFQPHPIQDPDLLALIDGNNVSLHDVVILEFDFTPTTNFINFNYVFASDEYCELQNDFGDAFGFFINGPGINGPFSNGAINLAVLPDGNPVNAATVNNLSNSNLFQSNRPLTGLDPCGTLAPVALDLIEFDGFTVPLTAGTAVIPCETYHLKLILADVDDPFTHSAVFFQQGSFSGGLVRPTEPAATAEVEDASNAPLEGCSDGYIIFNRVDSNTTEDLSVYFNINSASTATFGVDYTMPTDSFIIPAGRLSDTLFITIFPDNEVEGIESIVLQILGTCTCSENQAIFYIADPPPIDIGLPDIALDCANSTIDVAPMVDGGIGDYRFQWSDGRTDSLVTFVRMPGQQTYYLSVTDNCQQTAVDSVLISAPDISAMLSGSYSLCDGSSANVPIVLSGGTSYSITITENGVPRIIDTSGIDTLWLSYTMPTDISLDSITADGCVFNINDSAFVTSSTFDVIAQLTHINCFGDNSGAIEIDVNGQSANYTFNWQQPGLSGFSLSQLSAGSYAVRISDASNCSFDTAFVLSQPKQALRIDSLLVLPQDCRQDARISVAIEGGTSPYDFAWSDGNSSDLNREMLAGGLNYTLSVTDANGCMLNRSFSPPDNRSTITATILSSNTTLTCSAPEVVLSVQTNYPNPLLYRWINSMQDTISTDPSLTVSQADDYTLFLFDPSNGCAFSATQSISPNADLLQLEAADTYTLTCSVNSVDLLVNPINYTGLVDYTWLDPLGNILGDTNTLSGVTQPGTYTLEALRLDNNCLSRIQVPVAEDRDLPVFEFIQSHPLTCVVNTAPARAEIQENGNYRFAWSTSNGQIEGPSDQDSILLASPGDYSLLLTNIDNGCSQSGTFTAMEDRSFLVANAGEDGVIPCRDPNFQLSGSASPVLEGTSFSWVNEAGQEVSNTAILTTQQRGNYTLMVSHPVSGCTSSDEVLLSSDGPTALAVKPELSPCPEIGGALVIDEVEGGSSPYRYFLDGQEVSLENELGSSGRISALAEGFHNIRVEDANGCVLQDTFQILERLPFEGLAEDLSVRLGESIELSVRSTRDNEIATYTWQTRADLSCTDCPNPRAMPLESFRVAVTLQDTSGCLLQLAQNVFVDSRELVYAPSAFSPRRPDGVNDRFTLYGDGRFVTQINYLRIFDRWGAMLYERKNFPIGEENEGWDGSLNGQALASSTYIFVAEVSLWNGTKELIKGSFHLVP